MDKVVFVFAALCLLFVSSSATALGGAEWTDYAISGAEIDDTAICAYVGQNSGCSGCTWGTKNFCTWASMLPEINGKRAVNSGERVFSCVPTTDVETGTGTWDNSAADPRVENSMCPADPSKEPMVSMDLQFQSTSTLKASQVSTKFSEAFDGRFVSFPKTPAFVDRTVGFESLGVKTLTKLEPLAHMTCGAWNNEDFLKEKAFGYYAPNGNWFDSAFLKGSIKNEHDRYCARQIIAAYLTVVCPEYGKAMSFLCQSLAKKLDDSCAPCDTNVEPVLVGSSGMPFYNLFVVPDDTPYCLKEFTHYPSGELEKIAHLHDKDTWEYNKLQR